MIDKDLLEMISKVSVKLRERFNFETKKEEILFKTTKLWEEVGEFNSEILKSLKIVRKEKLENYDKTELEMELADVILSALTLADSLDIDVNKALNKKIEKIKNRWGI